MRTVSQKVTQRKSWKVGNKLAIADLHTFFFKDRCFLPFVKINSYIHLKQKAKLSEFISYWLYSFFLSAHSQRLVSVQSMLRQTGRYRNLERDLLELQERKLFEYFIVVALHKAKAGVPYLPEVTQQFPLQVKLAAKMLQNNKSSLSCKNVWFFLLLFWLACSNVLLSHPPPLPFQLERSFKFMRETEDQLKVIPQFCFPDAKDWAMVENFPRSVLTLSS